MKRLLWVTTAILAIIYAGDASAQNVVRTTRSPSVIRPIGFEGHWGGYHAGGDVGCGCAAPTCAAPASCCAPVGCAPLGCGRYRPCGAKLLCIVPCAIKRFGRALDCLLPCNTGCASACGLSCSSGCSSCTGGVPALSDPFIDDPVETLSPPTPAPTKDVRRHPVWNSPTAARPATVNRYVAEPSPIRVASRSIKPIPASATKAAVRSSESSVLKRTSHEVEVASDGGVTAHVVSDLDDAPAPPARLVQPEKPRLLDFDVPVNPLR